MIEIQLPKECIEACSHSGECDSDVEFWLEDERISKQIDEIPMEAIVSYLRETGAWDDEELQDEVENKKRLLWLAANDCQDEKTDWFLH